MENKKYAIWFLSFIFIVFGLRCTLADSTSNESEITGDKKAQWIKNAFDALDSGNYPRIKALSWWHENFDNSRLRIDSSKESLAAYRLAASSESFITEAEFSNNKLKASDAGLYISAFPDFGGTEDKVSASKISDFENLAGKKIVWAYFSNNWYDEIKFPAEAVNTIHNAGRLPFIRLMPRSNFDEGGPDVEYTMQNIIEGKYDEALIQWAKDAAALSFPVLAEFGTEVNGNWFPWNGQYNGGAVSNAYGDPTSPDGPERFRDAYKHIIELCRNNSASNITWFFHVDAYSQPDEDWNKIANYYPGDDYIDWLGLSAYGPQEAGEEFQDLSDILDDIYPQLEALSSTKPIALLEFAVTELE